MQQDHKDMVWQLNTCTCNTVFALLDAAATIYFARQFGAASIGERRLLNSVGIRR